MELLCESAGTQQDESEEGISTGDGMLSIFKQRKKEYEMLQYYQRLLLKICQNFPEEMKGIYQPLFYVSIVDLAYIYVVQYTQIWYLFIQLRCL